MLRIRTILHPTDLSPLSRPAFDIACALANDYQSRLIVLHVKEPLIPVGELVPPEPPDHKEALWRELRALKPEKTIAVDYRLEEGLVVDGILAMAQATYCDLIVLGTHGRSGLRRVLMGSVAELVLRNAPCPVLVVKASAKSPS